MAGFMTALADRVASLAGTCRARAVLDDLSEGTRANVNTALADPGMITDVVVLALADMGVRVSISDLQAHRDGRCPCVLTGGAP